MSEHAHFALVYFEFAVFVIYFVVFRVAAPYGKRNFVISLARARNIRVARYAEISSRHEFSGVFGIVVARHKIGVAVRCAVVLPFFGEGFYIYLARNDFELAERGHNVIIVRNVAIVFIRYVHGKCVRNLAFGYVRNASRCGHAHAVPAHLAAKRILRLGKRSAVVSFFRA